MAIEVTDEMRRAVCLEMCERDGHRYSTGTTLQIDSAGRYAIPDALPDGRLPHLSCPLCGAAWLVVAEGGMDYDDAIANFTARYGSAP